jgi:hypothetical protein
MSELEDCLGIVVVSSSSKLVAEAGDSSRIQSNGNVRRWKPSPDSDLLRHSRLRRLSTGRNFNVWTGSTALRFTAAGAPFAARHRNFAYKSVCMMAERSN